MKKLLLAVCAVILSVGVGVTDAEAKRLGGGKSLGMQRSTTPTSPATAPTATSGAATAPTAAAAAQPRRNGWRGPVAGLAAGLGLAALASHLGFGEEFGNIMLIALVVMAGFMIFRLLARRKAATGSGSGLSYAGAGPGGASPDVGMARMGAPETPFGGQGAALAMGAAPAAAFPAGFDAEGFARQAKVNFLRLQTANDTGNLADLREFTSPEMFAELQMDLRERQGTVQHTEVMDLQATVLSCVEESGRYIVSVRFNGLLREDAGAAPADFDEVWHLVKPVQGNQGWVVAGIQQTA